MNNEEVIKVSVLVELFNSKSKYKISASNGHQGIPEGYEGYGGEYNERFVYYRHPEMPESLFLQETYNTDSYGESLELESSGFFKQETELITNFRKI